MSGGSQGADGSTGADGSGGTDGSPGAPEPGPGQVDPSPPAAGGAAQPVPADPQPPLKGSPLVPSNPGGALQPHQWTSHSVSADGLTLTFNYYAGVEPCSIFDSIVAKEGPDVVVVTIYERSGPEGIACIMLAQEKSATVTLVAPLGSRSLVDGAA